ncbi:inorganic phosphate transporter [Thermoplasma sp.]|uniref:inorganic phosphate transporter n=1 Tax=Thermoplasma sp. TaxID=1973142 RepID=UPI0012888FA4|nr:inorganic phosphate transporter [Thermoplasma sp.]KAA8922402.1 MAG: inorganic phosphate transporter [Thermoplasma sp.]
MLAIIVFSFLLVILVAGNNSSAVSGTIIGSKMMNRYVALAVTAGGYIAGYLLEGQFLQHAVNELLPFKPEYVLYAIIASFIIFTIAFFVKVPISLTMALVGSAIGLSLKLGYSSDFRFLTEIIIAWIAAPLISIGASYIFNDWLSRMPHRNLWSYASAIKGLLIITAIFTAFTLGANTIGFLGDISGTGLINEIMVSVGSIIGTFFFSSGIMKSVSQNMYMMKYTNAFSSQLVSALVVEVSTLFSIPMSNTQTLTSAVLGSGLSYRAKAIYLKPFLYIVVMWILSPLIGLAFTYVLA